MFNSTFHIKLSYPHIRSSYTCFSVFGASGQGRQLGLNNPNHGHRYTESDSKCSTLPFTSNKFLLSSCFKIFGELGQFRETGSQCPDFFRIILFLIPVSGFLNWLSIMQTSGIPVIESFLQEHVS